MQYWLVKSEPESYSWETFEKKGGDTWDGVRNFQARNNLKAMQNGDMVLFYHSGKAKAVVGLSQVEGDPYPEPDTEEKWISVDLKVSKKLKKPVPLAAIKSNPELEKIALVRQSQLSVMPLSQSEFQIIMDLAEL